MLHFREEMLRQRERDLDRRLRTAYLLRMESGSRTTKPRRLRRRVLAGAWWWGGRPDAAPPRA